MTDCIYAAVCLIEYGYNCLVDYCESDSLDGLVEDIGDGCDSLVETLDSYIR